MAEETVEKDTETTRKKGRLRPVLIGCALLSISAGGGYFGASTGLIPMPRKAPVPELQSAPDVTEDVAFVALSPLTITLGRDARNSHLRFHGQLEVDARHRDEVARLEPRFLDALNGYLQALEAQDIEDPAAFVRMGAQLLRRMQVVAGEGRIRDLLVTEFVLN